MKAKSITSTQELLRADLHMDFPDVSRLRLTDKQKFIKQHKDLIKGFAEVFGDAATIKQFHLTEITLWQIKTKPETFEKTMSKAEERDLKDRIFAEALKGMESKIDHLGVRVEDITSLRREVRELKSEFGRFVQITADRVTRAIVTPLLQGLMSEYSSNYNEDGENLLEEVETESVQKLVMSSKSTKKRNRT